MKVQVRGSSLTQKLSSLRANREVVLAFLERLMGVRVEERPSININLSGTLEEPSVPLMEVSQAFQEAMDNRPEIKAAKAAVRLAFESIQAARADHWPQLSAFGRYGVRSAVGDEVDHPSQGLSHEDTWAAGFQSDVPLFRAEAVQAGVRQATLGYHRTYEQFRATELAVRQEVEQALTTLKDAVERIEVTKAAIGAAQETMRIEQEKYAAGKNSINDVLDAQAALLEAQTEYSQALTDGQIAVLQCDRAMGRDLAKSFQ